MRRPAQSAPASQARRAAPWARQLQRASELPGPFRRSFWRSPIRGPWLTSVFGLILLAGIPVLFVTGLLSYAAYNPDLSPLNDQTPGKGLLGFYLFSWPTHPVWLYRLNQGVHVTLGLVLVPILLAKLWSVLPKLFEWPPLRDPAHALERLSLFLLVGGVVFEFATGILNIQQWYVFPGSFYRLHFYGAWVFIAGFVVHVGLKAPRMVRSLRSRSLRAELRTDTAHTVPEPADEGHLVSPAPRPRRSPGAVRSPSPEPVRSCCWPCRGPVAGRPAAPHRPARPARPGPRRRPRRLPDQRDRGQAAITAARTGASWRLTLSHAGPGRAAPASLSRAQLLAMAQHTAHLPIACVEGWSTGNQAWTGVRLRDLARLAGARRPASVLVESLERGGTFRQAVLSAGQIMDPDSLLALRVNGADLSLDHGFPRGSSCPPARACTTPNGSPA